MPGDSFRLKRLADTTPGAAVPVGRKIAIRQEVFKEEEVHLSQVMEN